MAHDDAFIDQIADGYEHLYDTVYLRTHPLTRLVPANECQSNKDMAWRLHHLLLDAIDELDPGPDAPPFSREWRRHRLMVLRYCDGLHPQDVADRLAISQRSYYRELRDAIEAVAILLAERHPSPTPEDATDEDQTESLQLDRMGMLRMEAGRLASEQRQAALGTVVDNAVTLVHAMCQDQGLMVNAALDEMAASVMVNRNALRQVLLGTLSHVIQSAVASRVVITAASDPNSVDLLVTVDGPAMAPDTDALEKGGPDENGSGLRLAALCELAEAQGIQIEPLGRETGVRGYRLRLSRKATRTVLVVDDNDDILQLFERYLAGHGYAMLTARDGTEAISLAKSCLPDAITLDLMMPEQDGWDVLVTLTNQPDTQHIPIIVCSVLGAKALSLSLGASLFLEKPASEQSLLSALTALGL